MIEVVPAVLVENYNELKQKLAKFVNLVDTVQIDICDGKFVPSVSWPMHSSDKQSVENIINEEEGMPFWEDLNFEFDLMMVDAHKQFDFFAHLGAKRIVFHIEAEGEDFLEFLESIDPFFRDNIDIGIAINTTTDISKLEPIINYIDFVQCMGIERIGFQGEQFDERVLDQIKQIRSKYPELKISIDGSVNENTAKQLVDAGVNKLVVGSALSQSYDIRETIRGFENL